VKGYNPFGGKLFSIPFKAADGLYQKNETLILLRDNTLFKISENSSEILPYFTPKISIQDLQLTQDFLYIYDGKKLHTFAIKQPKK
jgi:hypothetical protein